MFQNILNFILSPAMVPILIAVFAIGGRLMKWMNENQAQRKQIQQRERARAEALRTGKPLVDPGTVDISPAEMKVSTKAAAQARLEGLRQQRIEQLRKLREQRAGGTTGTTQRQTPRPQPARRQPRPVQQRRAPAPAPQQRAASTPPRGRVTSSPQVQQRIERQKAQREHQARQESLKHPHLSSIQPHQSSLRANPELNKHVGTLHVEHADSKSAYSTKKAHHGGEGVKKMLSNRSSLRNALIAVEVLSKPVGLRDPGADF